MDVSIIKNKILQINKEVEDIFSSLAVSFPQLLAIKQDSSEYSIHNIQLLMNTLLSSFSNGFSREDEELALLLERSSQIFYQLNTEMHSLEKIHKRVEEIRWDSEELEIISLNAMVISIKSGEKGRAFSCITENLKRLSSQMICLSDDLLSYEKKVVEKNSILQSSFSTVLSSQNECTSANLIQSMDFVLCVLKDATASIEALSSISSSISNPIRLAMSGIQLQDIIRQSMDQLILLFNEIKDHTAIKTKEETLDVLTVNISLYEVALQILHDIELSLSTSKETFFSNWNKVQEILAVVDSSRTAFISTYLNTSDSMEPHEPTKSFSHSFRMVMQQFSEYTHSVVRFQKVQKTVLFETDEIVGSVKYLKKIFDTLVPIIVRLQHVRITQEIEVAKNSAIRTVKDTVTSMSSLIANSEKRIEHTRKELDTFIELIEKISGNYTQESEKITDLITRSSLLMNNFFTQLSEDSEYLTTHLSSMHIYPEDFTFLCEQIESHLSRLQRNSQNIKEIQVQLGKEKSLLVQFRSDTLEELGVSEWKIHNTQLQELVKKFTITNHKIVAGSVGGFEVDSEKSELPVSGVTLFF